MVLLILLGISPDNSRRLSGLVASSNNKRVKDSGSRFREEVKRIVLACDNLKNQGGLTGGWKDEVQVDPHVQAMEWGDVSLRQWLDKPERSVDKFECLHIFRQIAEIVNVAYAQGVVLHNVRPSCFVLSSFNHVSSIESASCSESRSDSSEDVTGNQIKHPSSLKLVDARQQGSIFKTEELQHIRTPTRDISEARQKQSSAVYPHLPLVKVTENRIEDGRNAQDKTVEQHFPMKQLFCPFSSREEKNRTMSSLRHRVLPPQLLLKWPKEASFCLWLLHPEPSNRPKMSELLQSEFLSESGDDLEEREAALQLRGKLEEQELLLEFLLLVQGRKQEAAEKLQETVALLSSDIEDAIKQSFHGKDGGSCVERAKNDCSTSGSSPTKIVGNCASSSLGSRKRFRPGLWIYSVKEESDNNLNDDQNIDLATKSQESLLFRNSRLMKTFKKLESAYFLTRCGPVKPPTIQLTRNSPASSDGRGSAVLTERSSINNITPNEQYNEDRRSGWISPFLEGLCKYLLFSALKVKADLTQGELLSSSNLVCSIGFDRDGEFFATAGVNKKIKIFDCDSMINEGHDIHYPVVEMASRSKLSSICWNSYIKSQIASSSFEGVVQLWDVTRSQVLREMREHEQRIWSVDFSSADPTILASGSDDGSVKLWSINQGTSIGTIKTKANVCSVQFTLDSSRFLAFGSADHRVYYYDLRYAKVPLCTLIGHNKTVSFVRFVDSTSLASSSTDNTVKLWDLSVCASRISDTPLQSFTGHTNVKNFVGLSVSNGYIATGSETNEVFIYSKAFPMPALSFKFNNTDPISGHELDNSSQFVSSVCWRRQSSTVVAANSAGSLKILEMV